MRRSGSRYGLPATNRSLKYSMQPFQRVAGCLGVIYLPNDPVPLSLKKHARWQWIENRTINPDWSLDAVESADIIWCESYTTSGGEFPQSLLPLHLQSKGCDAKRVVNVEYLGRSQHISRPVDKSSPSVFVHDERYGAYLAAYCCGCSFCSEKPRCKASKKTKGRQKHSRDDLFAS